MKLCISVSFFTLLSLSNKVAADDATKTYVRTGKIYEKDDGPSYGETTELITSSSKAEVSYQVRQKSPPSTTTQDNSGDFNTNIVGGQQSDVGEFPYYVDMSGCGGTLIAPNVVLSAAHCGGYRGDTVYVSGYRYGSTANGATAVKVTAQRRHPNYDSSTMENDFFLYKLEQNVYPSTDISLSLNRATGTPSNGQMLTVTGLGTTSSGGSSPTFLRDVDVPTVSNSYCSSGSSYGNEFMSDVMLCAGDTQNGNKDSCQGDSGGPIVIRNGKNHILVGVVSWGYGCGDARYPGVYARVSSAMDWIESQVCNTWNIAASFCSSAPAPTPAPQSPTPAPVSPTPAPVSPTPAPLSPTPAPVNPTPAPLSPTPAPVNPTPAPLSPTPAPLSPTPAPLGPTPAPLSPTPAPLSPTPAPQSPVATEPCIPLQMIFKTDKYPEENSFTLETEDGELIWDEWSFARRRKYVFNACLPPDGCTTLSFIDTYGDGIINRGFVRVKWNGRFVLKRGSNLRYGFTRTFGTGC